MKNRKDITLIEDETYVKRDLNDIIIPGVVHYRGVPLDDFSKEQLMNLIYLLGQQSNQ